MKSGLDFDRRLLQFQLNSDPELYNTTNDLLKFLTLWNLLSAPIAKDANSTWHGNREISNVLFQIMIEMYTKTTQIVVDISASTGASHRACTTSRWHFIGSKADKEIFDVLLKPLCEFGNSNDDDEEDKEYEDS